MVPSSLSCRHADADADTHSDADGDADAHSDAHSLLWSSSHPKLCADRV